MNACSAEPLRSEPCAMSESEVIREHLDAALQTLIDQDVYLVKNDLSERCIAARLALYLQAQFASYFVDVEYNRQGASAKELGLPDQCARRRRSSGQSLVVPDIIVHRRGASGPNLLVIELKKAGSAANALDCDRVRLHAFRSKFGYQYGALVQLECRTGQQPQASVIEWLGS